MKFFIDTADIAEIRDLAATGLVDGVTTNPTLVAKSGRKFLDVVREICEVVPGPVSAEVAALDGPTMLAEGRTHPALGDGHAARSRAYSATRGPRKCHRHCAGLAGQARPGTR